MKQHGRKFSSVPTFVALSHLPWLPIEGSASEVANGFQDLVPHYLVLMVLVSVFVATAVYILRGLKAILAAMSETKELRQDNENLQKSLKAIQTTLQQRTAELEGERDELSQRLAAIEGTLQEDRTLGIVIKHIDIASSSAMSKDGGTEDTRQPRSYVVRFSNGDEESVGRTTEARANILKQLLAVFPGSINRENPGFTQRSIPHQELQRLREDIAEPIGQLVTKSLIRLRNKEIALNNLSSPVRLYTRFRNNSGCVWCQFFMAWMGDR